MPAYPPSPAELGAPERRGAGYKVAMAGAGLALAAAIDSAPGLIERFLEARDSSAIPEPIVHEVPDSDFWMVLDTGCDQKEEVEAEKAVEQFGDIANIYVARSSERFFSPEKSAKQRVEVLRDSGAKRVVFGSQSLGLVKGMNVAAQPVFQEAYPELAGFMAIAGATQWTDIAPRPREALHVAGGLGYSTLTGWGYPHLVKHWPKSLPTPTDMPPRELVKFARLAGLRLPNGALKGLVQPGNAFYIDNPRLPGYEDDTVFTNRGWVNMGRVLALRPERIEDPRHPAESHVGSFSRYPIIPRQLLLGMADPRYRDSREYRDAVYPDVESAAKIIELTAARSKSKPTGQLAHAANELARAS
jgi:hypothetical protein